MSKDQAAGDIIAGKDEKLPPDELSAKARRAKLTHRPAKDEQVVEATAAKTEEKQDDFYFDALLRFGIQI